MQSLVLATSLVLSTPASISTIDSQEVLDEMVNTQVQKVSTLVVNQTQASARDTFLLQAKMAINSGSHLTMSQPTSLNVAAE